MEVARIGRVAAQNSAAQAGRAEGFCPSNLFAMFAAYFDESGNPDEKRGAMTVAGSISSVQKWLRSEPQWEAILKRHGVETFHMHECAKGVGEYKGWSTEQRCALIGARCFGQRSVFPSACPAGADQNVFAPDNPAVDLVAIMNLPPEVRQTVKTLFAVR